MERYLTTIKTFDSVAEQYLEKFKGFSLYQPSYDAFLQALNPGQTRILEVACGPGQVSHYLLQQRPALAIKGIDMAPNMVSLAKTLNPQANYSIMDCRDIKQLKTPFDAIMCGFCVPYLAKSDTMQLIQDMADLLPTDGLLYLSTTTGDPAQSGYQTSQSAAGAVYIEYHAIKDILEQLKACKLSVLQHDLIRHTHNEQATTDEIILARKQP